MMASQPHSAEPASVMDVDFGSRQVPPSREPVPEVYFGEPASQAYGQVTRELAPSSLDPATVERAFVEFFSAADPAT